MNTFLKFKTDNHGHEGRRLNEIHYRREARYQPLRYTGVASVTLAIIFGVVSICTDFWIVGKGYSSGLWDSCFRINGTTPTPTIEKTACDPDLHSWQKAVIGLLCFAVGVGFLATILSICGLCVHNLPKKLYYYHSAGEIFFVCALSSTLALIAYPTCMEKESGLLDQRYGYSYAIGWGSTAFFFAASFCMMLDDMIHSASTRGCCFCCKRKKKDGDTQNV